MAIAAAGMIERQATETQIGEQMEGSTMSAGVPYLDEDRFVALVERTPGLALIDFTADWCPPCRRLAPAIDALARELAGSLAVAKVDADEQPALAARFHVRSLPTLLFFRNGQLIDTIVGAVPPAQLRARASELGASPV